jgi:Tfp pilus assembly protein PilF
MKRPLLACAVGALALALLAGCAQQPTTAPTGVMDLAQRPAEKALLAGMRSYDDGQYGEAEKLFNTALGSGLASAKDKAAAHKYLAFIYCTSERTSQCEAAFKAARAADPAFSLTKSEAGHPMWGPVYRRASQ